MTDVERSSYFDGMILQADDLSTDQGYARGQRARHNRYLHTWGVAEGLTLEKQTKQQAGQAFVDVTLQPGVAVDGTGREVVVDAARKIDPQEFKLKGLGRGGDPTAWFSVFIVGRDLVTTEVEALSPCDESQPDRAREGWYFDFGTISDADPDQLDDQQKREPSEGPGGGEDDASPWRVLVGFVRWDKTIDKFSEAETSADGRDVRYAGVCADDVEARGESLSLRAGARADEGRPALQLAGGDEPQLIYGLQDDRGRIATELMKVDAEGNLWVPGALRGAYVAGAVYVQSGLATDGMVLPLPPGVKEEDVADGKVHVHVLVTPTMTEDILFASAVDVRIPACEVDDDRRVSCRVHGLNVGNTTTLTTEAGVCRYTVLAAVPAEE